jgi:D-hexose-6-phosphate mutarotase
MFNSKGIKRSREEASKTLQKKFSTRKEEKSLTEEEKKEYANFIEIKKSLELELSELKKNSEHENSIIEIMELLHEYNDIKDATQIVIGALATMRRVTVASLHEEFDLPLKDE